MSKLGQKPPDIPAAGVVESLASVPTSHLPILIDPCCLVHIGGNCVDDVLNTDSYNYIIKVIHMKRKSLLKGYSL